jgi:hypothetical protein
MKAGIIFTRATIDTAGINPTEKTFPVVFATENPVYRSPYWADESFFEVLVCDKKSIRADRLDGGVVPLLDAHSNYSILNQYGSVLSWSVADGECRAVVKFSEQDGKADIWKDIVSGNIKGISAGYRIWSYERVPDKDPKKTPTYRAVDWEPFEISLAPVPADFMSSVRAEDEKNANDIKILNYNQNRSDMTPEQIEEQKQAAITAERKRCKDIRDAVRTASLSETFADELIERSDNGQPLSMDAIRAAITAQQAAPKVITEEDITRALENEQKRCVEIRTAVRNAKMGEEFADELIAMKDGNRSLTVDQAKAKIHDKMVENDPNIAGRSGAGGAAAKGDERTHIISAMTEGMMHRAQPGSVQKFYAMDEATKTRAMDVKAHDYKHMSFIDIARSILTLNGVPGVMSMSSAEVAKRALDTTDLPDLFTSTVKRFLRMNYEPTVPEWMQYSRQVAADDFRTKTGVKFDAAVTFEELGEDGEYKEANMMSDEKATIQLQTFARSFGITRKTIINDDLSVLTNIPRAIGIGAKQFQSKKVWGMITSNVNTPDGKSLFHAAHGNLAAGGGVSSITDAALSAGRTAMRRQKSPQGNELDIQPKFVLVPPELETTAQKYLRTIYPTTVQAVNMWSSLVPDVNVYLADPLAWYMIADIGTTTVDGMVHSYLTGQEGLFTESYIDKKTDKLVIKARLDFACAMWGWQGWYKNPGAAVSGD